MTALSGMLILLWGPLQANSMLGVYCGLGSAITYSIYVLITEKHQADVEALPASLYVISFAALGLWIYHSPLELSPMQFSPKAWVILLGISTVSTILPISLVVLSLQKINSSTVSLLSLIEPLTAVVLSMVIFQEKLTPIQGIGAVIVFGCLWMKSKLT